MAEEIPKNRQVSITAKLNTILFPFDVHDYASALSETGYLIEEPFGILPAGLSIKVSGIVGRKANAVAHIDMSKYLVGVHSTDTETAVEEYLAYEHILESKFKLRLQEIALYHEFITVLDITTDKDPVESFTGKFKDNKFVKSIGKTIGSEVSIFGARFYPAGEHPNQLNWYEFRIEPKVEQSNTHYRVYSVWRHESLKEVFGFINSFDDLLTSIIELIEE